MTQDVHGTEPEDTFLTGLGVPWGGGLRWSNLYKSMSLIKDLNHLYTYFMTILILRHQVPLIHVKIGLSKFVENEVIRYSSFEFSRFRGEPT